MTIKLIDKISFLLASIFIALVFIAIVFTNPKESLAGSSAVSQQIQDSNINTSTVNSDSSSDSKSNSKAKLASYLSGIRSIAVEFSQTDTKGSSTSGMLIIDKPHRFRCNYYAPFPLLIVGNKNYVSIYDYELQHFGRIKAEENIFNFLLLDKADFEKDFEVLSEQETGSQDDGYIELMLYHEDSGRNSKITFDKAKKQLKSIQIFEEDNEITVSFKDTRNISKASRKLFILQDPDIFGTPARLSKQDLVKLMQFFK